MLQVREKIKTIDTHTMGEATRIVVEGFPEIKGNTMLEKKIYVSKHYDHIRKLLMNEPRGHKDMFGAIITEQCNPNCDIGVLFMDGGSYLNMCIHGTIGTVTMCVSKGYIEKKEEILIDAPVGIIRCKMTYSENGCVESVTVTNVPSFVLYENIELDITQVGKVSAQIAFGGSFFGIIAAEELGLNIDLTEKEKIVSIALEAREKMNRHFSIKHPIIENINTVDLIEISKKVTNNHYRNVVVFGDGQIDRSPCGTGTCAKMATLQLLEGEEVINESIIGSQFIGKVERNVELENYNAIIPSITGRAWITGEHTFILEQTDIFPLGFKI